MGARLFAIIPLLLLNGFFVAAEFALVRARRTLENHGLAPEYHEFPMGHQVTAESLAVVAEFIRPVLAQ